MFNAAILILLAVNKICLMKYYPELHKSIENSGCYILRIDRTLFWGEIKPV